MVHPWYKQHSSFLKPDFSAGTACFWSHSMRTCVWMIPRATMAIVLEEKAAHKRLNPTVTAAYLPPLSLAVAAMAAAAAV